MARYELCRSAIFFIYFLKNRENASQIFEYTFSRSERIFNSNLCNDNIFPDGGRGVRSRIQIILGVMNKSANQTQKHRIFRRLLSEVSEDTFSMVSRSKWINQFSAGTRLSAFKRYVMLKLLKNSRSTSS